MNFKTGEIFAIDKPYGITSFKALAHVRYQLSHTLGHKVKIGHAGTLDPLATGVLILCTGKCTKLIETLQAHSKEYEATLQLGATTPSYDMEHPVDNTYATSHITLEAIQDAIPQFVGDIQQTPPTFSACKVDGKRAYTMRRKGEDVTLKPKNIHIDSIEITGFDPESMQLTLRIVCGKGTYIRALARDLGRALGSGAYLTYLRRTRVGEFNIDKCIEYNHFQEWLDKQEIDTSNETVTV